MTTSPISPVATKLVTNLLAGLIARRETATSDLRLACSWLFGALLERINGQGQEARP